MTVRKIAILALSTSYLFAAPAGLAPEAIVENYCAASRSQAGMFKGASMDIDIEASIPKLKKEGRFHALRRISALGRITYEALKFDGDGTVKNQVITRYLTAEAESQKDQSPSIAVTPDNYKFKYKGVDSYLGRDVHVFQVTPKKKRPGLFKGDIWIDAATYLRVRESGYLVKNPSIFLKRVEFVRNYEIQGGVSIPRSVESVVRTRLVGTAELKIDYTNILIEQAPASAAAGEAESQ